MKTTKIITAALLMAMAFSFAACNHRATSDEDKKPTPAPGPTWKTIKSEDNSTDLKLTVKEKDGGVEGMFEVKAGTETFTGNYKINKTRTKVTFSSVKKNGNPDSTFPADADIKSLKLEVMTKTFDLLKADIKFYEIGNKEEGGKDADTYMIRILELTDSGKKGKFAIYKKDEPAKRSKADFDVMADPTKIKITGAAKDDGADDVCAGFENQDEDGSCNATDKKIIIEIPKDGTSKYTFSTADFE